jgi:hypothetical protein
VSAGTASSSPGPRSSRSFARGTPAAATSAGDRALADVHTVAAHPVQPERPPATLDHDRHDAPAAGGGHRPVCQCHPAGLACSPGSPRGSVQVSDPLGVLQAEGLPAQRYRPVVGSAVADREVGLAARAPLDLVSAEDSTGDHALSVLRRGQDVQGRPSITRSSYVTHPVPGGPRHEPRLRPCPRRGRVRSLNRRTGPRPAQRRPANGLGPIATGFSSSLRTTQRPACLVGRPDGGPGLRIVRALMQLTDRLQA